MVWFALIMIAVSLISGSFLNKKKRELTAEELALFDQYRGSMKGRLLSKKPADLAESQSKIWDMAAQDWYNRFLFKFAIGVLVVSVIFIMVSMLALVPVN